MSDSTSVVVEPKILKSRSEGVALRPFSGLDTLENLLKTQVALRVKSNRGNDPIPSGAWLGLPPKDIQNLGLKIEIESMEALLAAIAPVVMDLADVSVFVVALDRRGTALRESEVLLSSDLASIPNSLVISEPGVAHTCRILGNQSSGFRVELAFIQNKDVPGENAIRPRKKGALIARVGWDVKPESDGDSIQPDELTDEIRTEFVLSKDAWIYFRAEEELLLANSFDQAAKFYVDREMLRQIKTLSGEGQILSEMLLYSSAVTHLIYEVSFVLRQEETELSMEKLSESQVFRLFQKKFSDKSESEIIEFLKENPARVVSSFLASKSDYKKLIDAIKELNGGSNDLSLFDDE